MKKPKTNYGYIEKIVYSKQFRNLQDKTQLFYSFPQRQVRTRLTHTIEVKIISHSIGAKLNLAKNDDLLDLELIDAIAFAHDIGHTPFGHVGERTIDDIVSKKDRLGGLINDYGMNRIRFKHNINSMRILENLNIDDWRIIDGALCHTNLFYKNDNYEYEKNPYNPFENPDKIVQFLQEQHKNSIKNRKGICSLTLEGQVVAVADEIAQRVADISDGLESRYFEKIQEMISNKDKVCTRLGLEQSIRTAFIEDVVSNTLNNLKQSNGKNIKLNGIESIAYNGEVVGFSPEIKSTNKKLEGYITDIMAQSESVRESDSRSKYIIRQLYKAFLNDVTLLPDEFIDDYFKKVINKDVFKEAFNAIVAMAKNNTSDDQLQKNCKVMQIINRQGWRISEWELPQNTVVIKMNIVKDYFHMLTENSHTVAVAQLNDLLDEYILKIGFYIAGLTNTECVSLYNRIYGH